MAAAAAAEAAHEDVHGLNHQVNGGEDPFLETDQTIQQPYFHRFSSRFELDAADLGAASSPSQVKRVLEAHLLETERRLQDTHKLGTSLLQQQSELQDKLLEVEQQQDEAEISPELKQRLASIGREHDDVSREIARSLLAPKSRAVSGEEKQGAEPTTLTSQATGSPTKISAPNRRSRNQPTNRAGDLQFAADISTSLLVQVRQLQAAVAERDETIKSANSERSKLEQDVQVFSQKLRSHDENEQRYKDENWNLQAQTHELLNAQRDAAEKEKRLHAAVAHAKNEKTQLLSEFEESRLAYSKAVEDHQAAKKAHETEMHGLKRDFDSADSERLLLQNRLDELTAQNQELAKAMSSRYRDQSPQKQPEFGNDEDEFSRDLSTPEHSPPPSPTKATPRHGGLESETLKSSLHHAHRMIQNLKGNIHREKTEKIELKRMLQDARDELEQRRNDSSFGSGSKKQKAKNDMLKKSVRPDMLGGSRRARTDIEMHEDEWEDQAHEGSGSLGAGRPRSSVFATDLSDAYQTAHETESNFETADERQTTESEAFETGAESLAGDSSDDLTETESTAPRPSERGSIKHNRPSFGFKSAGTRDSYLSTASTSAGEEDEEMQTPVQPQLNRFKLRNGRSSSVRQTQIYAGTPDSAHTQITSQDSPATITEGRSPPAVEQSLFAELEGINDTSSNFSTPARSGVFDLESTPSIVDTPSKSLSAVVPAAITPKPAMKDSSTMTEPWQPVPVAHITDTSVANTRTDRMLNEEIVPNGPRVVSIGDFPLPPSVATSTVSQTDTGTQYTPEKVAEPDIQTTPQRHLEHTVPYTPSRTLQESPVRSTNAFITPPKTVWDTEHESEIGSPDRNVRTSLEIAKASLAYSGVLTQDTVPLSPVEAATEPSPVLAYSSILSQQTTPVVPPPSQPPTIPLPALPDGTKKDRTNTDKTAIGATAVGLLAGAAAALGLSQPKDKDVAMKTAEDETNTPDSASRQEPSSPLGGTSGNTVLRTKSSGKDHDLKQGLPIIISSNDQSSQTMLTADAIQRALEAERKATKSPMILPPVAAATPELPAKALSRSPDLLESPVIGGTSRPTSPPLRPSSASSSHRPSTANKQYPPLPSDYKSNIARANSLVQNGTYKKDSTTPAVGTVMGPPLLPASAMRRPKTSESTRSHMRDNATPRVVNSTRQRGTTESQLSHRSSMSSFASEVDERFNLRMGPGGEGYEGVPGTDPRMIQAITQTMIGEYLWKYTRKAASKEMSTTRHRRYFWVHPYTKTLYWSTTDPSTPGAKESTSRSVPIESIRVVSDDNPMPPGLHRKSLEVTTPTRKVKFTAATGQRHETWFNALSYLLLRGEPADAHGAYATGGNEITREDIDEFRASADPHLVPRSRQSMSSYNSRTTAGTSKRVSAAPSTTQRQALPSNVVSSTNGTLRHQGSVGQNTSVPLTGESTRASRAEQSREGDKERSMRAASLSRVSRMLGSITGRSSRQGTNEQGDAQHAEHTRGPSRGSNSIYDASVVSATRDSAEEARQEMLKQEPSGGLENVRACCDGKHDVSTLSHSHRHSDRPGALSSMSDRINRSMSKRI